MNTQMYPLTGQRPIDDLIFALYNLTTGPPAGPGTDKEIRQTGGGYIPGIRPPRDPSGDPAGMPCNRAQLLKVYHIWGTDIARLIDHA